LSESHSTVECTVKKERDKLLLEKKDTNASSSSTGTSGHLRNVKEKVFKDAVSDNTVTEEDADALIDPSKDTNEDHMYYFAHMSNHYLHLVKASPYLSITS
jgi:hypothetical protein